MTTLEKLRAIAINGPVALERNDVIIEAIADIEAIEARNAQLFAILFAIRMALSFDPAHDRDLESCARRIYNERDNLACRLREMEQARDDAIAAAHIIHENNTREASFVSTLLEQAQQQIDEIIPVLVREKCKDDYEHGHKNGVFFMLVELRRSIKAEFPENPQ